MYRDQEKEEDGNNGRGIINEQATPGAYFRSESRVGCLATFLRARSHHHRHQHQQHHHRHHNNNNNKADDAFLQQLTMSSGRHAFTGPEMVASLMPALCSLYLSYAPDSFPFEWLRKTEDIEVQCRDSTEEEIVFLTPPELLNAIHKCERITAPEKQGCGLPSDYGFDGFMGTAILQVLREAPFTEPHE